MELSVQSGKYGAIYAADPKTMAYYVVKYVSDAFTLQEYITTNNKVSNAVELAVRAEYLSSTKEEKIVIGNRKKINKL